MQVADPVEPLSVYDADFPWPEGMPHKDPTPRRAEVATHVDETELEPVELPVRMPFSSTTEYSRQFQWPEAAPATLPAKKQVDVGVAGATVKQVREFLVSDEGEDAYDDLAGIDRGDAVYEGGDGGYEREVIHHDGELAYNNEATGFEDGAHYGDYDVGGEAADGEYVGNPNKGNLGRTTSFRDELLEHRAEEEGGPALVEQPLEAAIAAGDGDDGYGGGEAYYYPEEEAAMEQEVLDNMYATESHAQYKPPSAWQQQQEPQGQYDGGASTDAGNTMPAAGLPSTVYDADFAPHAWNASAMLESLRDTRHRAQQYKTRSHRSEVSDRLRVMAVQQEALLSRASVRRARWTELQPQAPSGASSAAHTPSRPPRMSQHDRAFADPAGGWARVGAGGAGVATAFAPAVAAADAVPRRGAGPTTAALAQDMLERAERRSRKAAQRTAA